MAATTMPSTGRRRPRRARPPGSRDALAGYLLLLPALIALAVFIIIPMGANVVNSLKDVRLTTSETPYVGLDNWRHLIEYGSLVPVVALTALYTVVTVAASVVLGLAISIALIDRPILRRITGTVIILPVATSLVVASAGWRLIFDPAGPVNKALESVGIPGPEWLQNPTAAKAVIIIVGFWSMTGLNVLLYEAALSHYPKSLRDAARLFGVWEGTMTKLRLVVPLLHRTTVVAVLISTIVALRAFDQVYALTYGGPFGSTRTLAYLSWEQSFQFFNLGAGSVAATMVIVLVLAVTAVEAVMLRRLRTYS